MILLCKGAFGRRGLARDRQVDTGLARLTAPQTKMRRSPAMLNISKLIPQGAGLATALLKRAGHIELDWDVRQKSRLKPSTRLEVMRVHTTRMRTTPKGLKPFVMTNLRTLSGLDEMILDSSVDRLISSTIPDEQ
ncbi:MAG: hypothetical protein AUJ20_14330 [Comamonadaceae bacterium CG1_02_60_18]|nr:MAG: hypothetical protein AUJ20_14330 [Comamonadaceae bacterium CG1_02_60_18]